MLKRKFFYWLTISNFLYIIVLLILAGVTIAAISGDNGILQNAGKAKEETDRATDIEKIKLAMSEAQIGENGYQELDATNFQEALNNQFEGRNVKLIDNGDGNFIISLDNDNKMYYADSAGQIINDDNMLAIGSAEELKTFRDDVNSGNSYEGKYVYLTSNIILDSSEGWEPIGKYDVASSNLDDDKNKPFKGIFDGCKKKIDNLQINTTEGYQGLFGLVIDATIRNITVEVNSSVIAGDRSGVIIGCLSGSCNVYNCINYANVNASGDASGGIVGYLIGQNTVFNCKNYGNINSKTAAGGIVGSGDSTSDIIINCGNYGTISSSGNYCGGIAGFFRGDILNCCNKAEVNSSGDRVAGIVGTGNGIVKNCYNIGDINGKSIVGGILGTGTGAVTINCYSVGEVTGTGNDIGDIIGGSSSLEPDNCYIKGNTFKASDLGDAFKNNQENENQPLLYWE